MKLRICIALLAGLILGAITMRVITVKSPPMPPSETVTSIPPSPPETDPDPLLAGSSGLWWKREGLWISLDGRQSARIENGFLLFLDAQGWPDLAGKRFLLGNNSRFLSDSGFYTISYLDAAPDWMSFIKEDLGTNELTSFTVYREGSTLARSRKPLPAQAPPAEIRALIDFIPSIRQGESWESVSSRCPSGIDGFEILDHDSNLGETHLVLNLGKNNEWFLRADHGDSGIYRFQVVRGMLDDNGDLEITDYLHPSYYDDKIITGVHSTGLHEWKPAR